LDFTGATVWFGGRLVRFDACEADALVNNICDNLTTPLIGYILAGINNIFITNTAIWLPATPSDHSTRVFHRDGNRH
jgi:hypothetical protein